MPKLRKGILAAIMAALPAIAPAAETPLSESLSVSASRAFTWQEDRANVAQFDGPVHFELDGVTMDADSAVVWISPSPGVVGGPQQVEIALIGNASLQHNRVRRSGDRLFVTAGVRDTIRLAADQRAARNLTGSDTYQIATGMREESGLNLRPGEGRWRSPRPSPFVEKPEPRPPSAIRAEPVTREVTLGFDKAYTQKMPDGTLAVIVDKNLIVTIRRSAGEVTQLLADRGVVFTAIRKFTDGGSISDLGNISETIESVYLEGDVRVFSTPRAQSRPDSRLEADEVYYEVGTDRAVLTHAVVHTMDPSSRVPIVMRARILKQLSRDDDRAEFRLEKAELTTSSFATPSYAIAAEKAYVRQMELGDWYGTRTSFSGKNATMDIGGAAIAWLPYAGGTVTERGFPLRALDIGTSNRFGFFTRTEWGLFESIGRNPPRDLDLSYRVDYLAERGPAGGLNADYRGHSFVETTHQPASFNGDVRSYFVLDAGTDQLGGDRNEVDFDNDFRGRVRWEHQQFLPDDWQVQLRAAWVSDATFLEEYFQDEFYGIEPMDTSAYLKHQRDAEAITFFVGIQPNHIVTTQEFAQENFEIERVPELGYYRLGETFGGDALTLYSANTLSRLGFQRNSATFQDMGYPSFNSPTEPFSPGLPAQGYTGTTDEYVTRGDFRQEVAIPVTIDKFRVQPYVMGRYTGYDDSPTDGGTDRAFAGAGIRMSTQLWRVDDSIASEFWDIHRMRHVVEPELHVFGSIGSGEPEDVFVFDQPVDAINDITAVQVAVRQKWQTKRGGPDNWHNVDFFAWGTELNIFGNKPDNDFFHFPNSLTENEFQAGNSGKFTPPDNFRGLFFPSAPETSIPRDSINSDQAWRISDSTIFLSDEQFNLSETQLATASAGLAVRRGDRVTYYIGQRYINPLDSNILSFVISYELSARYLLGMNQSYDFGQNESVTSSFLVTRRFDRFAIALRLRVNDNTGDTGLFVSVRPTYLPKSMESGDTSTLFK